MTDTNLPQHQNGEAPVPSVSPISFQKDDKEKDTKDDIELLRRDRPVELFRSYDQGMMDGLLENNSAYFEQFIDAFHFREFKNKSIYLLRGQLKDLLDKQADNKTKLAKLREEKCAKESQQEAFSFKLVYLEKIVAYWREKIVEAKESSIAIKTLHSDYGLFAAFLFFVFALLFIAADYTICLTIVANALKIGLVDNKPTLTSHLFALAMAGLSVVLKPAYDRLVEKPYHHDKKKTTFTIVIIILAFLVLGMLTTLGIFREEVIAIMMDSSGTTDIVLDGQLIGDNSSGSTEIAHTWARTFGIVSSTVLFAIAGAVCLGIAIPIFHKNFRNYWNRFRRRNWHKKEHKILEQIANVESKRAEVVLHIKAIDVQIGEVEKSLEVDETIKEKQALIQIYQHGEMVKNIAKSNSLYLAGYERGQKLIGKVPQDWLFENVYSANPSLEKNSDPTTILQGKQVPQGGPIGKRTRPFVALRRMISHNFKKKWNKDNDINIEYYNFD